MKTKVIIILIILFLIININYSYSQNINKDELKQMYKEYSDLVFKLEEPLKGKMFQKDIVKIINLLIKIIKTSPESAEAYHALASFPVSLDVMDDEPKKLFLELENKYINNLSNSDDEPAEKLVFMMLTKTYPSCFRLILSEETDQGKYDKCINGLQFMASSQNKDFAALATTELFDRSGTGI